MSSSLAEALDRCRAIFEGVPPFGPLLRERFADRWLRLASLPAGRSRCETVEDRAELLGRQNLALLALLGEGSSCLVVTPVLPAESSHRAAQDAERSHLARLDGLDGAVLRGWASPEVDVRRPFEVELCLVDFRAGVLDARLLSAADGRLFGLVVLGLDQQCALSPGASTFDVVAPTRIARDALARRWSAWLPES